MVSDNCEPKYKNLNQIQSFSEQRYVTVQLMEQICMNEEYLKQFCDRLEFLSPPAIRKRFKPILVDNLNSYGCDIGSDGKVLFSNSDSEEIDIDFSDTNRINLDVSDVIIKSYIQGGIVCNRAELPQHSERSVNYDTKNFEEGEHINAYWYVGYNKEKSYQVRPDWLKDWREPDIHSVVRAQTFTPNSSGLLEAVTLAIGQTTGASSSNWGCPLYVQIWPTSSTHVNKMVWDKAEKEAVVTEEDEIIYEPKAFDDNGKSTIYNPLAEGSIWPDETSPGFFSIVFDNPCQVTEGEHYAIVMFSPLSNGNGTCPRIGGWGLNCATHKYEGGDAFLSNNNGRTFARYGRNDDNVNYKQGKYTPRDFAFQCNIVDYDEIYDENVNYLYLKPILTNPITHITLSATDDGDGSGSGNKHIVYQYSVDNGNTWIDLTQGRKTPIASKPVVILVRAKMWQTYQNNGDTPSIDEIIINLTTEPSREMYVRTHYYRPKSNNMLGANVWGRINVPFLCDPKVNCHAEIIHDKISKEHFEIITVNELEGYIYLDGIDASKIVDKSENDKLKYLVDNPSVIQVLKENNVYVKPAEYNNVRYEFSFNDGIQLSNSPSYPIRQCRIQPKYAGIVLDYMEWLDFEIDYDTDVCTFLNSDTIDKMPVGSLVIEYNPIFLTNITNDELPLILDYFEEDFLITDEIVESRSITLRCDAVDPIRKLTVNKGTENENELIEDVDFEVDYSTHTLNFIISDLEEELISVESGDTVHVVYTPNLEDSGISIGYYATREENALSQKCEISENYIEYKV